MPEQSDASNAFDHYADQFVVTITPFGANLSFGVREAHPSGSRAPQATTLGTIRMSVEHLKLMTYILRRQVLNVEKEAGVKADVSPQVLNQMGIHLEDWEGFWRSDDFKL